MESKGTLIKTIYLFMVLGPSVGGAEDGAGPAVRGEATPGPGEGRARHGLQTQLREGTAREHQKCQGRWYGSVFLLIMIDFFFLFIFFNFLKFVLLLRHFIKRVHTFFYVHPAFAQIYIE